MNKQYADGIMKLGGQRKKKKKKKKKKVTSKFYTLWQQIIFYKITTQENKSIKFSSSCHCNDRDYNEGKYPLRITLLDRFQSNLDKAFRWAKSLKIYENLTDVTVIKLPESIFQSRRKNIF